ncbi:MAG: N-6 DNA methylase [Dehalococcoidia bacterium]|nr:N-6 DNA methylase [Dehalococcoidia bacterium]
MALAHAALQEIVAQLASRPGHPKVSALIHQLLTEGLEARSTEIHFELPLPEVHGKADALLGRTVFEFKSNLRRERGDAEAQLSRYLSQREADTGERFVGIATDGATYCAYELRRGDLRELATHSASADEAQKLLVWLAAAVAVSTDLPPDPDTVRSELGRSSIAWHRARGDLAQLWDEVKDHPDVRLKRDLWARMLERVYGAPVDADDLFFQHTYLTVVAKTMAVHVLGLDMPEPAGLLSGQRFTEVGITGVVESDFFDWPLAAERGADLVGRIAAQAARFRLRDVETDVLKGLYESLIDPEQRHDLGEYYTPDWLAAKMCERAIERPLEQRVLDPACGSGTFLFHAVRRLLAAADTAGMPNREALAKCCDRVRGIDVHPVAVQIARVTYLLALGEDRLPDRPAELSIPVYMGDSLQWDTSGFMTAREVQINVPEESQPLHFPFVVAQDPALFDSVISRMLMLSEQDAQGDAIAGWLKGLNTLSGGDVRILGSTYEQLRRLRKAGRNHIWGFVARNLVRPAWLSREAERADVIIGNPPWLSYRYMSKETQKAFKAACEERGIWAGGKVATQQDLSAYFFARCVELYFLRTGVIAFVMPYAAMSRRQFEGFRRGVFGRQRAKSAERITFLRFVEAWAFPEDVQPLFPVPSCVLIGELRSIGGTGPVLPATVLAASGTLPRRDASPQEAAKHLTWREEPWPAVGDGEGTSPYGHEFRNGATIFPRVLCVVEKVPRAGRVGSTLAAPVVQSRRTNLEKQPWKDLPPLRESVEAGFLRELYLGESIAPFRLLRPALAVIPWDGRELLDSGAAQLKGHTGLSRWLAQAEALWRQHGRSGMTFQDQIDYYGKLSAQLPPAPLRVMYSKAGTLPAAVVIRGGTAMVENTAYWAAVGSEAEGRYLEAILNSETARSRVEALQARGQWGARHFDKVMFSLPIPKFEHGNRLHQRLARAGARAEQVAARVELREGEHFVRARQRIRAALREDGVAGEIDRLVAELLE